MKLKQLAPEKIEAIKKAYSEYKALSAESLRQVAKIRIKVVDVKTTKSNLIPLIMESEFGSRWGEAF